MKFRGAIGFSETKEDPVGSGVWKADVVERMYRGDVLQNIRRWDTTENLNNNFSFSNRISVVADSYIKANFGLMKYITLGGVRWSISSFEIAWPRLIISLGGVYNGKTPTGTTESSDDHSS